MKYLGLYFGALSKWILIAVVIGILSGLLGSAFHIGVEKVTELRLENRWLIFTLPLSGLLIAGIYRVFHTEGQGTNDIISEVQQGKGLSWKLFPSIFFSTILTHLSGGSAGREGAALQMGGTVGFSVGKILKLDDRDIRMATMAGMAAFFSALFGTPLAATIFVMEVISVGLINHAAFIPCFTASLTAFGISRLLGIEPTRFLVQENAFSWLMLLKTGILAALAGFVSVGFCEILHAFEHGFSRFLKNPFLRAFVGGIIILLLSLVFSSGDYNGAGMNVIEKAVQEGQVVWYAFLMKILFTAVTLGSGFKGGEVVPSFFVGAAFGCLIGPVLGIPAGFAASIGLIAVFCGAVNSPIASVFLAMELFGGQGLLYYALACGLSYVLSGYSGIYSSQKIVYDKVSAGSIDTYTNSKRSIK